MLSNLAWSYLIGLAVKVLERGSFLGFPLLPLPVHVSSSGHTSERVVWTSLSASSSSSLSSGHTSGRMCVFLSLSGSIEDEQDGRSRADRRLSFVCRPLPIALGPQRARWDNDRWRPIGGPQSRATAPSAKCFEGGSDTVIASLLDSVSRTIAQPNAPLPPSLFKVMTETMSADDDNFQALRATLRSAVKYLWPTT